ncbi:damage-inducible protein DinB [Bacillus sp. 7586-K]|uniref:Damage-inducible protein DinB n=1 Tax=Metabacillus niabensis TaxID=324854 RepID=A0ABT9Z219_9BACI|nr:DinB family protein [Metabacillus niabensis]MDQ0226065.1 putative damage-inducible protein DinB [Metabacillus niabensis]PAD69180.1 damage-inducible protein DinB [Bacillus sp. 7586-K]
MYYVSVIHQIEVAVNTIIKIIDNLSEEDLQKRPTPNKHSIGELLEHLVVICEADWRIANEASKEDMEDFYSEVSYNSLESIKEGLLINLKALKSNCRKLTEEELLTETTSYWGLTYSRYEWLLEILAHVYHHRGQLHAMLVHCYDQDPGISMFE